MVVSAPVVEVVHPNGDDAGLVPPDPLLPHPDGVGAPLEVQVGVLLSPSVNVLSLIPNYFYPKPLEFYFCIMKLAASLVIGLPVVILNFWIVLLWERKLQGKFSLIIMFFNVQIHSNININIFQFDRWKFKLKIKKRNLKTVDILNSTKKKYSYPLCDSVIDLIVSGVIHCIKFPPAYEKCWPILAVTNELNVQIQNLQFTFFSVEIHSYSIMLQMSSIKTKYADGQSQ